MTRMKYLDLILNLSPDGLWVLTNQSGLLGKYIRKGEAINAFFHYKRRYL